MLTLPGKPPGPERAFHFALLQLPRMIKMIS
jgi:hypothetical protein